VVIHHPLPTLRPSVRLWPVTAPWHPAGRGWRLAGAKTLSYAPNTSATREAIAAGFDDAVLVSEDGTVLEGPTFSVAWVVDGVVETPPLALLILESITRRVVLECAAEEGMEVRQTMTGLARLAVATETMVWSTVREVTPVTAVGERTYPAGEVSRRLLEAFHRRLPLLLSPPASSPAPR
jgi:branched-subunit amino acid aminotransferase/4-amino-4-deoxychorismate lyase